MKVRDDDSCYFSRYEKQFPLADTEPRAYYLDLDRKTLAANHPASPQSSPMDVKTGHLVFKHMFEEATELTGGI